MKENEVTAGLSARLNWKKQEVDNMLATLGQFIGEKLAGNDSVTLPGLGTLEMKEEAHTTFFNPANKKHYLSPPKQVAAFTPNNALKSYLKNLVDHE